MWAEHISSILHKWFNLHLEVYTSFTDAENRLLDPSSKFDLLITDLYPSDMSREAKGLKFVEFCKKMHKVPVVVVTGESHMVKSILREKEIDVFDKAEFEQLDFVSIVDRLLKYERIHDDLGEAAVDRRKFIVERISLGKVDDRRFVRILVVQAESSSDYWSMNDGLMSYTRVDDLRLWIWKSLDFALRHEINVIVFPELSVPVALLEDLGAWSQINKDVIVIAGSHYAQAGKAWIARSPVFLGGRQILTDKIFPSPSELSSIDGFGLSAGERIIYFTETGIGSFFVLICSDNLKPAPIRNQILSYQPDFVFSLAFQRDSNDFFVGISDSVNNGEDVYFVYANNHVKGMADGRSAFFGIVRPEVRDELINNQKTDFVPKGKLCELRGEENVLIVEADIRNKNPPAKRKVGDLPNVKIFTGRVGD
ncbi:Predicted amidohydrolase [Dyadobacter soli]|uniref:Predicted amidohydrolase n=2 Tax=Dyadobacter soli TaxID=659014 RepID=A0A1G7QCQ8_9BACT|nr:Predicted amidohydrolase [Dyadobacter soli]